MRRLTRAALALCSLLLPVISPAAGPTCVVAKIGDPLAAKITFTAPTTQSDGTPMPSGVTLTYNIYQGTASGAEVKVASGVAGSPITVSTGLTSASTYYWYITTVDSGGESLPSNEGCKIFPAAVPGQVTITIT